MLSTGDVIDGKYRILGRVGEGGMGVVYAGENVRIRRRVAIKVLHASVAQNHEVVARFEREAQAAGCIGSDHILEVLDIGALTSGERYIVMEFLEGESLGQRLTRLSRLTTRQVVPIFRQLLAGLDAAHSAGIVHRDLKPDNVFIVRHKAGHRDFVKIIDFGISKFQQVDDANPRMTRSGIMMGTPLYMAPEQASGRQEADVRSDIYSVGVMLYECLCGEVPFMAKAFNELLFQIVLAEVKPLAERAEVDDEFCQIVAKAMAKDPAIRYQSCAEMAAALDAWATRHGVPSDLVHPSGPIVPPHSPRPSAPLSPPPAPPQTTPWPTDNAVSYTPGGMHTPSPPAANHTPRPGFGDALQTPAPEAARIAVGRSPARGAISPARGAISPARGAISPAPGSIGAEHASDASPFDVPAAPFSEGVAQISGHAAGFLPPRQGRTPTSDSPLAIPTSNETGQGTLHSVRPSPPRRNGWTIAVAAALALGIGGIVATRSLVGSSNVSSGTPTAAPLPSPSPLASTPDPIAPPSSSAMPSSEPTTFEAATTITSPTSAPSTSASTTQRPTSSESSALPAWKPPLGPVKRPKSTTAPSSRPPAASNAPPRAAGTPISTPDIFGY